MNASTAPSSPRTGVAKSVEAQIHALHIQLADIQAKSQRELQAIQKDFRERSAKAFASFTQKNNELIRANQKLKEDNRRLEQKVVTIAGENARLQTIMRLRREGAIPSRSPSVSREGSVSSQGRENSPPRGNGEISTSSSVSTGSLDVAGEKRRLPLQPLASSVRPQPAKKHAKQAAAIRATGDSPWGGLPDIIDSIAESRLHQDESVMKGYSCDYDVKSESDDGGVLELEMVENKRSGSGITEGLEGESDKSVSQDSSEKISQGNFPAVALPFKGLGTQGDAGPGDAGGIFSSNNGAGYVSRVDGEGRRQKRRASVGVDYREPRMDTKLRGGDPHTFSLGYDTGIKRQTLTEKNRDKAASRAAKKREMLQD